MKKTEKLNFHATMKYANDLLVNEISNDTKRMTNKAFGLLIKIGLKTGIRVSDLLKLEYTQFTENRIHKNTFTLEYYITKTKTKNIVPIGLILKDAIDTYKNDCLITYGYTSDKIFMNYTTRKLFTREWASKKISTANKNGLMGAVVNVAGMHSIRRTAVVEVFEKFQDVRLAQAFLGHGNILTTSNYLQDNKTTIQDKLRDVLC